MENIIDMIVFGIQQMELPLKSMQYGYVIKAFLAALIIGPLLGSVGTTVVAKRMAFFSSAIGNSALAGVAIGVLLNEPLQAPYISLFSFAILFSIFLNFSKNRSGMSNDTLIGVFLATSLAVGSSLMLYVTRERGLNIHTLDKYLFGDILSLTPQDMTLLVITGIFVISVGLFGYNRIILSGLNPALAKVRKIPVVIVDYLFVVLIALLTVASVKIVGAVLVEALLVIPAASAGNISRSLRGFTIWSIIFATVAAVGGVLIPAEFSLNVPSGGAIIMISAIIFIVTLYLKMIFAVHSTSGLVQIILWHIAFIAAFMLAYYVANIYTGPSKTIFILYRLFTAGALTYPIKLGFDWIIQLYIKEFSKK